MAPPHHRRRQQRHSNVQEDIPSFGAWLRQRRRALDLTQAELAQRVGCARITIRRIEADELKPSKELAQLLASHLDVPPAQQEAWLKFARGLVVQPQVTNSQATQPAALQLRHTNLPTPLTSFVGREREISEVCQRMADHRLLTLTGLGGAGKTRLALAVAWSILGINEANKPNAQTPNLLFPDGIWWVELSPLTDATLLAPTIATSLGLPEQARRDVQQLLVDYLQNKQLLLLLDCCEQMVETCAQLIQRLLQGCPQLQIVTTSRIPLQLMGETIYPVPPLSLPAACPSFPAGGALLTQLMQFDAVKLFIARAAAVLGDFHLNDQNASMIFALCKQLDGIPLALELAAARLKLLSLPQIAERLNQRLHLSQMNRSAVHQSQSLRAAFDWSYELLSPAERMLFWRLTVFAGTFTLEAAEAICSDAQLPNAEIYPLLDSLVDQSLVVPDRGHMAIPRFHLLDTIRAYGLEKRADVQEDERLRIQHLTFFLQFAQMAELNLHRADQGIWLTQLNDDKDNLRATLEFALTHDFAAGMQLASALGWFWIGRGELNEGRHWLERALLMDKATNSTSPLIVRPVTSRAKILYFMGLIAYLQGDLAVTQTLMNDSRQISLQNGDTDGVARAQTFVATCKGWQGDFVNAQHLLEESLTLFSASGNPWEPSIALLTLSYLYILQRKYTEARHYLEKSVSELQKAGDSGILGLSLANLGILEYHEGNLSRSQALLAESLTLAQQMGNFLTLLYTMKELGHLARYRGALVEAEEIYQHTLALGRTTGLQLAMAETLRGLGIVALQQGEPEKAKTLLREGLTFSHRHHEKYQALYCLASLTSVSNKPWQTMRLGSFVAMHLAAINATLPPMDHTTFEATLTAARLALDEQSCATLWAEGQAMTLDEAVDYALTVSSGMRDRVEQNLRFGLVP